MLDKDLFIHSREEEFLNVLKENLIFEEELEEYYIKFIEKKRLPDLLGKTVKITSKQFGQVYEIINRICNLLELDTIQAYVFEDFYYGVSAKGIRYQWIEISAKTIEDFTTEELEFMIAKELYNIKFGNTYYSMIIQLFIENIEKIKVPFGHVAKEGIKAAMFKWHRVMNFSSDNFGYAVCGNLKSAVNAILLTILNNRMLTDNMNINEYIKQAEEIGVLDDEVYTNTKLDEMIPYGPYRIKNIISYSCSLRAKKVAVFL